MTTHEKLTELFDTMTPEQKRKIVSYAELLLEHQKRGLEPPPFPELDD